jgi:hypothetical protein
MEFKQASRIKLRIPTQYGLLSVEQLWDLSLTKLTEVIKQVKKELKVQQNDDELSFLDEDSKVDPEKELSFAILKDIYVTKKKENEEAKLTAQNKANNEKLLDLIYKKQNQELESKSIEELQAMLK